MAWSGCLVLVKELCHLPLLSCGTTIIFVHSCLAYEVSFQYGFKYLVTKNEVIWSNSLQLDIRGWHSHTWLRSFELRCIIVRAGTTKVGSITVLLTSCLTGLESAVCFHLQNRLIQTSQTGGQWYSDTSPFSIPWLECFITLGCRGLWERVQTP